MAEEQLVTELTSGTRIRRYGSVPHGGFLGWPEVQCLGSCLKQSQTIAPALMAAYPNLSSIWLP